MLQSSVDRAVHERQCPPRGIDSLDTYHVTNGHKHKQDRLLEDGQCTQIDRGQTRHCQGRVTQEQGIYKRCKSCQYLPGCDFRGTLWAIMYGSWDVQDIDHLWFACCLNCGRRVLACPRATALQSKAKTSPFVRACRHTARKITVHTDPPVLHPIDRRTLTYMELPVYTIEDPSSNKGSQREE